MSNSSAESSPVPRKATHTKRSGPGEHDQDIHNAEHRNSEAKILPDTLKPQPQNKPPEPVFTGNESVIPRRLIETKEMVRGYVVFLLIGLVVAAVVFSLMAVFFWSNNDPPPAEDGPPMKPHTPITDNLELNGAVEESLEPYNATSPTMATEEAAPKNTTFYNELEMKRQTLEKINKVVDNLLYDHFHPASEFLYDPEVTANVDEGGERLSVDLNELENGWFSLENLSTFVALKTHYEKASQTALEMVLRHKATSESSDSQNSDDDSDDQSSLFGSSKISSRHKFDKQGFPIEIEIITNVTTLQINFDWSVDKNSVRLSVKWGNFWSEGISVDDTHLPDFNADQHQILTSTDFDQITENYNKIQRRILQSMELTQSACDEDILVHAWQCILPDQFGGAEKCDPALHVVANIKTPQVSSLQFQQVGTRSSKCRPHGDRQQCWTETGEQTEMLISSPSHTVSLEPLRKLQALKGESKCQCEDSLKILKKSICPAAKYAAYNNPTWTVQFCALAFEQVQKRMTISAGMFFLACRSAFYVTREEFFCRGDRASQKQQAKTLQRAGKLYNDAISNLASTYELNMEFTLVFGMADRSNLSVLKTGLNFRVSERPSVRQHYIISKYCINRKAASEVMLGADDLQYLTQPCQKTNFTEYKDCEYGKYITLIFYVPKMYDFVE